MDASVIVLVVAAATVVWTVVVYNRLVRLRNEAEQGFSGIEVQLKRRADLIPNLVEAVKGYAAHESRVLESVTRARTAALEASGVAETAAADQSTTAALAGLYGVAEAYPDLKADANFRHLQDELAATEDRIAAARRYYNAVVMRLNTRIQAFPDLVVARLLGFDEREFYEVDDESDRAVPSARTTPA